MNPGRQKSNFTFSEILEKKKERVVTNMRRNQNLKIGFYSSRKRLYIKVPPPTAMELNTKLWSAPPSLCGKANIEVGGQVISHVPQQRSLVQCPVGPELTPCFLSQQLNIFCSFCLCTWINLYNVHSLVKCYIHSIDRIADHYLYTEVAAVDIVSQEEVLGARGWTSHLKAHMSLE